TFVGIAEGKEASVWTAKAHGDTKTLVGTDDYVGPHTARRFQQHQGHQVAGYGDQSILTVRCFDEAREVTNFSAGARVGEQGAEIIAIYQLIGFGYYHLKTEVLGAGFDDGDGLGMGVSIDEENIGSALLVLA